MGQINKGKIAGIHGNTARVVPSEAEGRPTAMITIPWHLRGDTGDLKKGTEVVYVEFADATGLLLGRADGEWGAYLPSLRADSVTASGVSLSNHVHSYSWGDGAGSSNTGNPR